MSRSRGAVLGVAALFALSGALGQLVLAEAFASAGRSAVPVAVFGACIAFGAVALHLAGRAAWWRLGWVATGWALCIAAGAWALLPGAWFAAGVGWVHRGRSTASCVVWYAVGVVAGVGWWWAFLTLR